MTRRLALKDRAARDLGRSGLRPRKGADRMSTCPECGTGYSPNGGGHCRGGPFGGCCLTFANDATASAHMSGPYGPPGSRRCLTVGEMLAKGWRSTPRGWTRTPAMTPDQMARARGGIGRGRDPGPDPAPSAAPDPIAATGPARPSEEDEGMGTVSRRETGGAG